ncbi:MAG: hypothetical protein H6527_04535 [Actinobacteria bacterium]|nr:hypothetical protein [Actinomycetota bacterium]
MEEIVRRYAVLATAAIAAGLLATGCSSTDEAQQTTENANAAVCLSLEGLAATVEGLSTGVTGTGDVTVSQAQEAINQVDGAYQAVLTNVSKLDEAVSDEVSTAQSQFEQAQMQIKEGLTGLDGDSSLSDVPEEEKQAIAQLSASYEEMNSSLGCGDAS